MEYLFYAFMILAGVFVMMQISYVLYTLSQRGEKAAAVYRHYQEVENDYAKKNFTLL